MALLRFRKGDMDDDLEHFLKMYDDEEVAGGYENFMKYYGDDNIEMDLTGKVLISVDGIGNYFNDDANIPIDILTLFVDEGQRFKYKPKLIYSGHIAFLIIERENGDKDYFYKDDECYPQTFEEFLECDGDVIYEAKERGFTVEDVKQQIEMVIKSRVDFNYKFDPQNIIILHGL